MKLSRRNFLAGAGIAAGAAGLQGVARATDPVGSVLSGPYSDPTLLSIMDTVIPGAKSDPDGGPGALEAETPRYLQRFDRAGLLKLPLGLKLGTVLGMVARIADATALATFGMTFPRLGPAQREALLEVIAPRLPAGRMLLRLFRAPYYTATENEVGFDAVGYPGPNTGYADFSFEQALGHAHPDSQDGNLP